MARRYGKEGPKGPSRQSGFSLIEILVVVGVLVILTALITNQGIKAAENSEAQSVVTWTQNLVVQVRGRFESDGNYGNVSDATVIPLLEDSDVNAGIILGPHLGPVSVSSCEFRRGLYAIPSIGPRDCFVIVIGGVSEYQCGVLATRLSAFSTQVFVRFARVKAVDSNEPDVMAIGTNCRGPNNNIAISVV